MKKLLIVAAMLLASSAFALDRHVFLNSAGGGSQLNDCGNPAHNSKGVAGNTDELFYCDGSDFTTRNNRIICDAGAGCQAWTRTTAQCVAIPPGGTGGSVFPVTNGVSLKLTTGETPLSPIYGHPQACVYNMAKSDSCEIHAGDYTTAGAQADESASGSGTVGVCDRSDCWKATVVAWGYGPNMGSTGYGTAASPGWLRGAHFNGGIDTWDSNRNKVPDADESVTSYPVIFNGNVDGDGSLNESTSCAAGVCTGDAFYGTFVGCGNSDAFCDTSLSGGQTRPMLDSDANGTFDVAATTGGPKSVAYFQIDDIEYKNYNGGTTTCSGNGVREALGSIALGGGGTTSGNGNGLLVDHIYYHAGAYSTLCQNEHYVAIFGDDENWSCSVGMTEIRNSLLYLDNRFVINDDCDASNPGASECGCSKSLHDNRIVVTNNSSGVTTRKGLIRLKSVDTVGSGSRPKQIWIYNNEIVWQKGDASESYLVHPECLGRCDPQHQGLGVISFHGNILRLQGGSSPAFKRISQHFCSESISVGTGGSDWTWLNYNNTYDLERIGGGANSFEDMCNTTGKLAVSKNNVVKQASASTFNIDTVTTAKRGNNICDNAQTSCTTNGAGRAGWWAVGTQNVGVYAGLANYLPKAGGPLDETTALDSAGHGPCDPDSDGNPGADYIGIGTQQIQWADIAGNIVQCPTGLTALDIGAEQNSSDGPSVPVCGNGVQESGEACDDGNTTTETSCAYQATCPNACSKCNATCTVPLSLTGGCCGDSAVNGPEPCDGALLNGHTCAEFGCSTATTPTCALCAITSAGCTGCVSVNPDLQGVSLYGVSIP